MRWARKCEGCGCWTREAMFLIRGNLRCSACGLKEIKQWNDLFQDVLVSSVALAAVGGVQEAESPAGCVAGVDSLNPRRTDNDK